LFEHTIIDDLGKALNIAGSTISVTGHCSAKPVSACSAELPAPH